MKHIHLILARLLLLANCLIVAHAAQPPTPQPPYVAPVPKNAHWTISFQYGEATKKQGAVRRELFTLETLKTGDNRRMILVYSDGTSAQYDRIGDYLFKQTNRGARLLTLTPDDPPFPYYTDGFLFAEKVDLSTFKDVVHYKGTECFHYVTPTGELWIATETLLPVAARAGEVSVHYQFLPAPSEPFAVSAEEQEILLRQQRVYNAQKELR